MKFFNYFGSLVKNDTGNSSKSFSLVMSSWQSFIVTLFICGILSYDAYTNGYIKTDLEMLGLFMLCVYGGVPAAGVPKIFGEKYSKKNDENKKEDGNIIEE